MFAAAHLDSRGPSDTLLCEQHCRTPDHSCMDLCGQIGQPIFLARAARMQRIPKRSAIEKASTESCLKLTVPVELWCFVLKRLSDTTRDSMATIEEEYVEGEDFDEEDDDEFEYEEEEDGDVEDGAQTLSSL